MRIDRDLVTHVARLASLEYPAKSGERLLSEAELEALAVELQQILDYVEDISSLALEAVTPTQHGVPIPPRLREDIAGPTLSPDDALANAAARSGDHLVVPRVLGEP